MWYFTPYTQDRMNFSFEQILSEVDRNEQVDSHEYHKAQNAENRHDHNIVCKDWHWRYFKCDKGDRCPHRHQLDLDHMPRCEYWEKHAECSNWNCVFRHELTSPAARPCERFVRGFCDLGAHCKKQHRVKDSICLNYLAGFCPDGPVCVHAHPKWVE